MIGPMRFQYLVKLAFLTSDNATYSQIKCGANNTVSLIKRSTEAVKNTTQFPILQFFYHVNCFIQAFTTMNDHRKVILQSPAYLHPECFLLLMPECFVPVKVGTDLSHRGEAPAAKPFLHMVQLTREILFYRAWMQAHRGEARLGIAHLSLQHRVDRCVIYV